MISRHIHPCVLFLALAMISGCTEHSNADSDECLNNDMQCSATGVPQLCITGVWFDMAACAPGQTCQNGECTTPCIGPECQTGCIDLTRQCTPAGIPQICISGSWLDLMPCEAGTNCQLGECRTSSLAFPHAPMAIAMFLRAIRGNTRTTMGVKQTAL